MTLVPGIDLTLIRTKSAPMTSSPSTPSSGLTYRDSGVDIEAGEALVDAIRPAAKATDRPGTMGGLGGFGALFDLKAAGFTDLFWFPAPMALAPS